MSEKPKALRLVNVSAVEKELRRLHAKNKVLTAKVKAREDEILTHSEAVFEATKLLSEEREKNKRLRGLLEKVVAADDDPNDKLTYIRGRLLEEIKAVLRQDGA